MALGTKTKVCGDLAVGVAGVDQHVFYQLDLLLKDVLADSNAFRLPEKAGEIIDVHIQGAGNICSGDLFVEMGEDIVFTPADPGIGDGASGGGSP